MQKPPPPIAVISSFLGALLILVNMCQKKLSLLARSQSEVLIFPRHECRA